MRLKFSPRQKVVSLALAILAVGILIILGFKYFGNIFADTSTQKTPITIALSNWDGDGTTKNIYGQNNQSVYYQYVTDKRYRCDAITIYIENANAGSSKQELIKNNRAAVTGAALKIAEASGLNAIDQTKTYVQELKNQKKSDTEIGEALKKGVVYSSLSYECNRNNGASVSYGINFKIPPEYQQTTATPTKTATPNSGASGPADSTKVCAKELRNTAGKTYVWIEKSLINPYYQEVDSKYCNGTQSASPSTGVQTGQVCFQDSSRNLKGIYKKLEETRYEKVNGDGAMPLGIYRNTAIVAEGSGTADRYYSAGMTYLLADNTVCAGITQASATITQGVQTGQVCFQDSSRNLKGIYKKLEETKYEKVNGDSTMPSSIFKNTAIVAGDSGTADRYYYQSSTYLLAENTVCAGISQVAVSGDASGSNDIIVKITATVKTKSGKAVNQSRITINKLTAEEKPIGSSSYLQTNADGVATEDIQVPKNTSMLQMFAEKSNKKSRTDVIDWNNSQTKINQDFIIDITDAQAEQSQDYTAAADTQGGSGSEFSVPTTSNWPGGTNSLKLIAVRRSTHTQDYSGYTPVGGVSFEIQVYTTVERSKNTSGLLSAPIANAEEGDLGDSPYPSGTDQPGSVGEQSATPEITLGSSDYPGDSGVIATDIPYDTSSTRAFDNDLLKTMRNKFNLNHDYSTSGKIVDNGLNSAITLTNLPYGVYKITLTKDNFKRSQSLFVLNQSGETKKAILAIAPNKNAEPPSIDSGSVEKPANMELYKANGYIYLPKYPWFGWQKEDSFISQQPAYGSDGVPSIVDVNGNVIGGNQQMQNCMSKKLLSVGAKDLTFKDVLLGAGGAYLLKQSSKQDNGWVQGGMIAGGLYSLLELAKTSKAKFSINYDQYDCTETVYGSKKQSTIDKATDFLKNLPIINGLPNLSTGGIV